jgi:hypothetical protein
MLADIVRQIQTTFKLFGKVFSQLSFITIFLPINSRAILFPLVTVFKLTVCTWCGGTDTSEVPVGKFVVDDGTSVLHQNIE